MSNYKEKTKHPETGEVEEAEWLDDYYGRHLYGVKFPDGKIFPAAKIVSNLGFRDISSMHPNISFEDAEKIVKERIESGTIGKEPSSSFDRENFAGKRESSLSPHTQKVLQREEDIATMQIALVEMFDIVFPGTSKAWAGTSLEQKALYAAKVLPSRLRWDALEKCGQ